MSVPATHSLRGIKPKVAAETAPRCLRYSDPRATGFSWIRRFPAGPYSRRTASRGSVVDMPLYGRPADARLASTADAKRLDLAQSSVTRLPCCRSRTEIAQPLWRDERPGPAHEGGERCRSRIGSGLAPRACT